MVIEPGNNINSQSATSNKARQAPAAKVETTTERNTEAEQSHGDSVSLSSASLSMAKVEARLDDASDVDSAKVAEIKAALDSGDYSIDAQAIAGKIQFEESQLG